MTASAKSSARTKRLCAIINRVQHERVVIAAPPPRRRSHAKSADIAHSGADGRRRGSFGRLSRGCNLLQASSANVKRQNRFQHITSTFRSTSAEMTSIAGLAPSPSRASTSWRKAGIDLQLHKHVLHVWSIDGRGESFCAECSIECRWACPPGEVDAALADGLDQLDADWEPEWTPQIGFWGTVEVFHERRLFWAVHRGRRGAPRTLPHQHHPRVDHRLIL